MATKAEFEDWLESPVTKDMKKRIKSDIQYMQDILVEADLDSIKELQGRIKACQNFLTVSYESIYE